MNRLVVAMCLIPALVPAQTNSPDKPTWWNKYQALLQNGADGKSAAGPSFAVGANVDASNECGPQSETFITLNPSAPMNLAAGSNEIFRLPMRGYFSFDGGQNHVNDKPMVTADTNLSSPFRDRVYAAWDAASGGSTGGGVRVAASSNGAAFTVTRADDP